MSPSSQKQWTVQGSGSFDNLKYNESAKVEEVGDYDVLVKCAFVQILHDSFR